MAAWELISLKPLKEMEKMESEIDRLWDTFLFGRPKKRVSEEGREGEEGWLFPIDVSETEDAIIVNAEIPGMDPQEIDVSLSGKALTIRGQKREEEEKGRKENYLLQERNYGSISRSVELPREVQSSKVKASYRNGVLRIVLPKSKRDKTRGIKIKTE
jgi:HSP20 family protein